MPSGKVGETGDVQFEPNQWYFDSSALKKMRLAARYQLIIPTAAPLTWGSVLRCCDAGWMSRNTASLLKMCRQIHASRGLPTSRRGKNFQASEISWDNTAERKINIFWGVTKGRRWLSWTGLTPQDWTYFISMDSKPAVSANALFTLRLLARYLSFSREYHICYISEIPGVKIQFMYYTKKDEKEFSSKYNSMLFVY